MSPLANQVHVDTLLSNVSIKYKSAEGIAMKVFPEVSVKKTSDLFRVYDRNLRVPETIRANRGEARKHQFEVSTSTYVCERHSLKDLVTDTDAANYDLADLRRETTEELTEKILARLELNVANLFTTTNWSLNVSLAATGQWSANTTVSNPIPVVHTGSSTVINNSGYKPNFGILPRDAYVAAISHLSITDRVKYTSADIDAGKLAALFDLSELLVPASAYDNSALGATTTITNFYGDNMFLGYKPPNPSPLMPSSGYTFRTSVPMVKRWRDETVEGDWIEVNMEYVPRVVASLSGYLIRDLLA